MTLSRKLKSFGRPRRLRLLRRLKRSRWKPVPLSRPKPMDDLVMELKFILEAILFTAQHPLTPKDLKDLLATAAEKAEEPGPKSFKKTSVDQITEALEQLAREHEQAGRSYRLACVAGSWQFVTTGDYAPWIKAL